VFEGCFTTAFSTYFLNQAMYVMILESAEKMGGLRDAFSHVYDLYQQDQLMAVESKLRFVQPLMMIFTGTLIGMGLYLSMVPMLTLLESLL
jgi:type II secretory pathway component PulF